MFGTEVNAILRHFRFPWISVNGVMGILACLEGFGSFHTMDTSFWPISTRAFSVVLPGEPDERTDQELQFRSRTRSCLDRDTLEQLEQWRGNPVEGESKEVKRDSLVG